MVLAAAGILLLATSAAVFFWTLRRGIFRRYPWEQFLLVGTSAALGLLAFLGQPDTPRSLLLALELAALASLTWYMGVGARLPRRRLRRSALR